MRDTAWEARTNTTFSYGPLYMDVQELDDQQDLTKNSSVRVLDVVLKTSQEL